MASSDGTCKLILLGNGSVGKTSIIARFVDDGFTRVYKQTVGLDFFEKQITLRGDTSLKMQVWDIGGQSISSQMLKKYIFGASVIFFCYDITDPQSFADLDDWHSLMEQTYDTAEDTSSSSKKPPPLLYLVGNKIDLLHLRKVTERQHETYATNNSFTGTFFVSASNGDNVTKSFYKAAGKSINLELSDYELSFFEKVVKASIVVGNDGADEGRTAFADEIEQEDLRAQERAANRRNNMAAGGCCIIQ